MNLINYFECRRNLKKDKERFNQIIKFLKEKLGQQSKKNDPNIKRNYNTITV